MSKKSLLRGSHGNMTAVADIRPSTFPTTRFHNYELSNGPIASVLYKFKIPLLKEILQELNCWNKFDIPNFARETTSQDVDEIHVENLRKPSLFELAEAGICLELNEYASQKHEAGLNLVNLKFDHINTHKADCDRPACMRLNTIPTR